GEVLEAQAEQGGDRLGHLVGGAGQDLVAPLEPGLLGRGAAGPGGPHDPHRRVGLVVDGEVEADPGLGQVLADDRRHRPPVVEAGDGAVEGEGQRVDDARLARPRRPDEREQLGALEVDDGRRPEGHEPGQLEAAWPHGATSPGADASSSTSSSNRATRRSSSTSRVARYSTNRSWGVRRSRSASAVRRGPSPSASRAASTTSTALGRRARTSSASPARAGSSSTIRRWSPVAPSSAAPSGPSAADSSPAPAAASTSARVPRRVRRRRPDRSGTARTSAGRPGRRATTLTWGSLAVSPKSSCSGEPA